MTKKDGKKPRRDQVPHASLNPKYNHRIRQEYIDQDYIDQLDDTVKNCKLPNGEMVTELEYLSSFMEEWNNASVGKQSEAENNRFHRTAQEVKDCTDRNNHRNGDMYGIARNKADRKSHNGKRISHKLLSYETLLQTPESTESFENELSRDINPMSVEDAFVNYIESKEIAAMIEEYDQALLLNLKGYE